MRTATSGIEVKRASRTPKDYATFLVPDCSNFKTESLQNLPSSSASLTAIDTAFQQQYSCTFFGSSCLLLMKWGAKSPCEATVISLGIGWL